MTTAEPPGAYQFGAYRLDAQQRRLTRDGQDVPLAPKTFDLLVLMVRNPGRAFSKQELMAALWPDTFVEEANLSFQISMLRKALGGVGASWIETVPKHGYRFAGQVEPVPSSEPARVAAAISSSEEPARRSADRSIVLAVIAVTAVLTIGYMIVTWRSASTPNVARFEAAAPLTAYAGVENGPSLSPDGSQVAFAWNGPSQDNFDVYIKLVGPGEPHRLTSDPARDDRPAWSPDGKLIAFQRLTSEISADVFVIHALGGTARKVTSISVRGEGRFGGSASNLGPTFSSNLGWSPDGRWLAFGGGPSHASPRGIWLLAIDHPEVRQLTDVSEHDPTRVGGDWGPAFSPDGRHLAFIREESLSASAVYVLPLGPGLKPSAAPVRLTRDRAMVRGLAWTPDSSSIVFSSGGHLGISRLYRVAVPARNGLDAAEPQLLPFGEQAESVSISRNGGLVYSAQSRDASIWHIALNQGLEPPIPRQLVPSTFDEQTPAYSPDGTRLAFASTRSGVEEIWVANADGSSPAAVTSMRGPQCSNPQWSPADGRAILFNSRREGSADLYLMRPDGSELHPITDHPADENEPRWSRDGRTIYFGSDRTGRSEVWKMAATGGPAIQVTKHGGTTATESPDGRFLYYAKGFRAPNAIWRVPVGGGEEQPVIEGLSYSLNFVVGDKGIYFLAVGDVPTKTSIDFFEFATGRRTTRLTLGKEHWWGMALSPDQRSLLYSVVDSAASNLMLVDRFR